MKKLSFYTLYFFIILLAACASLQQPQGGPRDKEPPNVLEEIPKNLSRNFKGNKIDITFDEYFKLSNEVSEISVSPAMDIPPFYKVKKKTLEITFKDSLEKNTTYTINFGKAIQDVNESNILKNFSFVFSTGPTLDSLQINGKVVSSDDNLPVKDATVFIFPTERDSLFGKKRASLFTTTDSSGNFSLKNLRENTYSIYGLKESAVDRIYNSPNEEIAFINKPIILNKDTSGIILKLFKEIPEQFRVVSKQLEKDGRISYIFNKPINKPSLKFIDPIIKDPIIEFSPKGDTASVWLKTYDFDSLKVSINSDGNPLDTMLLRRNRKETYQREILFSNNLSGGKIRPDHPFIITFNIPIESINLDKMVLLEDSTAQNNFSLIKEDGTRSYQIKYPWKVKKLYTLSFNEGAIKDIYGDQNKKLKVSFNQDEVENYGNLSLKIQKTDSLKKYVFQLLTDKGNIYSQSPIKADTTLIFNYIPTNKYKVRIIEDSNNNGEFDTGNLKLNIQPEKVWFFEKEIITRANWDREEKIVIPKEFNP